jgi:adenine C2-methylase RlmN of 23S rRNA A2503 and tRNA A37
MIFYSLFGDDGKLTDRVEKVEADKLEDKIKELAKKVYEAYTNRFENMFNQFLTDVDAYLAGRKTIDEFACVGENTSLKNQMTALLMKYRGDAKIIYPEIGRKFNMIFIQTPIGIDVIKCTHLSPDSA